jgi:hypothetical protein
MKTEQKRKRTDQSDWRRLVDYFKQLEADDSGVRKVNRERRNLHSSEGHTG